MLNSAPRQSKKYHQGLFIPVNKNKVIKLNNKGGLYFRSGLEHKFMIWLDRNDNIKSWGAELIKIEYSKTEYKNESQMLETTSHNYYPDFYYELIKTDGSTSKVVAEVKPLSETREPKVPVNPTAKQLKNLNYSLLMWNKNLSKWKYMIEYCQRKGFEFIIITEENLGK